MFTLYLPFSLRIQGYKNKGGGQTPIAVCSSNIYENMNGAGRERNIGAET